MLQKYQIFFKSILWISGLSALFIIWQGINLLTVINTLFLVSLFFFCIYCFKWLIDQGTFYTFQYSWQKTKRYVLFFLPKYWSLKQATEMKNDYDEETGEKIYHDFQEFYEYKQSQKWEDLHQLLCSSMMMLLISFVLAFLYM